jgi:hypothetical protein
MSLIHTTLLLKAPAISNANLKPVHLQSMLYQNMRGWAIADVNIKIAKEKTVLPRLTISHPVVVQGPRWGTLSATWARCIAETPHLDKEGLGRAQRSTTERYPKVDCGNG